MNRLTKLSIRNASRFCQFKNEGKICLGVELENGNIVDASGQFQNMKKLIQGGKSALEQVEKSIIGKEGIPLNKLELAPAISNPEKVICVGLNYRDHCEEQDKPIPKEPLIFNKFPSTIIAAGENIELPKIGCNTDLEAELAIIIGKSGRHIEIEHAMEHVFGYTIANDVSGRDWQKKRNGGQWLLGKTFDTFCPLGPIVDTKLDPSNLSVKSWINDDLMQDSNTKFLIFDIPFIINWISQICTLKEGDVILSGTPGGVGMHRNPPKFLQPGDKCIIEIQGLGRMESPVVMEQ